MVGSNDKRDVSKAMTTSMWLNKEDMSDLCLDVQFILSETEEIENYFNDRM